MQELIEIKKEANKLEEINIRLYKKKIFKIYKN
jgi:hypothetical protein